MFDLLSLFYALAVLVSTAFAVCASIANIELAHVSMTELKIPEVPLLGDASRIKGNDIVRLR
jgi:hypothetical protein